MREKAFRLLMVSALFLTPIIAVNAQSNELLDDLLSQDPAQIGYAAYLVLSAADVVDDDVSPEEALVFAQEAGYIRGNNEVSDPLSFGRFSFLLMKSFDIPGGVMYMVLPGPRYAAREVVYRGWSRSRRAPSDIISGDTAVRIMSIYLNEEGGAQ